MSSSSPPTQLASRRRNYRVFRISCARMNSSIESIEVLLSTGSLSRVVVGASLRMRKTIPGEKIAEFSAARVADRRVARRSRTARDPTSLLLLGAD